MLSDLSNRELTAQYKGVTLEPLTDKTPKDFEAVINAVSKAAANGVVISDGIVAPGGCSISAPVLDRTGKVVAAIDISGPASAFDDGKIESKYTPRVQKAAQAISHRLGYSG